MTEPNEPDAPLDRHGVNPGYAALQIAKALRTQEEHGDPATKARAAENAAKWQTVLTNIVTGAVGYGSRTPLAGIPAWVTTEVLTGGFASGELLAGGALREDERTRLSTLPPVPEGEERRALNLHCLTDEGMAELVAQRRGGRYDIAVPEEGAMLVVAWLAEHGHAPSARDLITELAPFFPRLRFYPVPLQRPRQFGSRVHLQTVAEVIRNIGAIAPNEHILMQKEAAQIWAPLHDRVVSMFLETVRDGWPCRHYAADWAARASSLLAEYEAQRSTLKPGRKYERAKGHQAQLRDFLRRCAADASALSGRDVVRIRLILNSYVGKRGVPGSQECNAARDRQLKEVEAPLFYTIAAVVKQRLHTHIAEQGLDDIEAIVRPIDEDEAQALALPKGTEVPSPLRRKIDRCLNETVSALVERDVITSAEVIARVLPQMTSEIAAAGISDPSLRPLYAAIYRAFRRRRSLLLLNLEKQISIEELPWIAAINRFRNASLPARELSKQTLEEIVTLAVTSFPQTILPNKLLQEVRALAKGADLQIPIVDEVAADIFAGRFSAKFIESAHRACEILDGTLYATYYAIDCKAVLGIRPAIGADAAIDAFSELCVSRAGVSLGAWDPARNGMVIEQQQILTTQNLATLFLALGLTQTLRGQLQDMAKRCFVWICKRQQINIQNRHGRLIMVKNTAYAWRQMIFFLSLTNNAAQNEFISWAEEYLRKQSNEFQQRFQPAMSGLKSAANGGAVEAHADGARRFLGWSKGPHWLLAEQRLESNRL